MSDGWLPDFVYCGTSRTGSTWLHSSLREHPEIAMPDRDPVNFFDVQYFRDLEWYREVLPSPDGDVIVGETSPGYMKSLHAPARIAEHAPGVNLLFCVRNPVDRAFSDWWHEKSFGNLDWDFDGVLHHHPTFDMLVRPGFYERHIERFEQHFADEQMKLLFFEDFKSDNRSYIQEVYSFLGVDDGFKPSTIGERMNQANHLPPVLNQVKSWLYHNTPTGFRKKVLSPAYAPVKRVLERDSAYKRGVDPDVREALESVYAEDVRALEERTGRDLNHWVPSVRNGNGN